MVQLLCNMLWIYLSKHQLSNFPVQVAGFVIGKCEANILKLRSEFNAQVKM